MGWSQKHPGRETLPTGIALDAVATALERQCPGPGLLHHSDRGIQCAAYPSSAGTLQLTPIRRVIPRRTATG